MNRSLSGGGDGQTPVHPDDLVGLRIRGIRTQAHLDEAERMNLTEGRRWAVDQPRDARSVLTDEFVRTLHQRTFGSVWSWAGTLRRTGTSLGIKPTLIATALRDALADAAAQIASATSEPQLDEAITRLHHRMAAIHPFVNGNGRTARLHTDLLARALQRPAPSWGSELTDARGSYLAALRTADTGDLEPLRAFIWLRQTN